MIETLFLRRGFVDRNGVVLEGFLLTEMVLRRGVLLMRTVVLREALLIETLFLRMGFIDRNGGFWKGFY